jgi:hypothetical protein
MRGYVTITGFLYVYRNGKACPQYCPFSEKNCGEHCPFFSSNDREISLRCTPQKIAIELDRRECDATDTS